MFEFLSWEHLLVIGLAALFIFGPERLPSLAQDAARGLRRVRTAIAAVREQMGDELGEEFTGLRDLDLRRYHPRTFIREQLLGEESPPRLRGGPAVTTGDGADGSSGSANTAVAGVVLGQRAWSRVLTQPPPFDPDAT